MDTPAENNQNPAGVTINGQGVAVVDRDAVNDARAQGEGQDDLLAGKFKTQDDLVKAYKELEGKLGDKAQQTPAEETKETNETNETPEGNNDEAADTESTYGKAVSDAITAAEIDLEAAQKHFAEHGDLSEEDKVKFEKSGFSRDVVDAYLKGVGQQAANAEAAEGEAKELAESQISAIKASVGGEESFGKLREFVATEFTDAEKADYNAAIGSGDFEKALDAVNKAKARFNSEIGSEGELAGGKNPAGIQGYADEREMMADMRKPEYKKSAAFRQNVERRVAASTFHVVR